MLSYPMKQLPVIEIGRGGSHGMYLLHAHKTRILHVFSVGGKEVLQMVIYLMILDREI